MDCPNCEKELENEVQVCQDCETQHQQELPCAETEQAAVVTDETAEESTVTVKQEGLEEEPAKKGFKLPFELPFKLSKKQLPFIGGAVALVVVVILAILLLAGGNKAAPVLYLKDKEIFLTGTSKVKPWQVTDKLVDTGDKVENKEVASAASLLSYLTYLTKDGKTLFYPDKVDDGASIYFRSTSNPKKEAVKLDSEIQRYTVSENGKRVVYLKADGSLYRHDLKEKEKISSDVRTYYVSADCKQLVFVTTEGDLYMQTYGKEKEKVASEIDAIEKVNRKVTVVYYTSEDSLYKVEAGKDKEKLLSDVSEVIRIYESGEIYFLKAETEELLVENYVIDDLKDSDALIVKPTYPTYPYSWNYDTVEAYNQAMAEYKAAQESYSEKYQAYLDKNSRDQLRNSLKDQKIEVNSSKIYFFDGKETKTVAEKVMHSSSGMSGKSAAEKPALIYTAYAAEDVSKVKISELTSVYDLKNKIEEAMTGKTAVYIAVKDTVTEIECEDDDMSIGRFDISEDAKVVYYMDSVDDDSHGDLYKMSISGGKAQKTELYDSDVYTGYTTLCSDGTYYYFKDAKDQTGDLYVNKERVDYDVYLSKTSYVTDSEEMLFYTEWDSEDSCGTMKKWKNGKITKVAEEVYHHQVTRDGQLLYLNDYSTEKFYGTLYLFKGNKSVKIADDVVMLMSYNYFD